MQTVLGRADLHSITEEVNHSKERDTYTKWKDKDWFEKGDYACVKLRLTTLKPLPLL